MATCELCGKSSSQIKKAKVMGSIMNVCENCVKYGFSMDEKTSDSFNSSNTNLQNRKIIKKKVIKKDVELKISQDAIKKIQQSMAKEGLNIKNFSRAINIKESTLNKIMSRKLELDISIAKKIENFLKIKIIEEVEDKANEIDMEDNAQYFV